ncbi:hypothetical protein LAZ40_11185 [Cereibacter sphaeroides]|uniref:hypothetical protein n=1 Tax=Cereibacter sphaeroides TaxID=1063 RepID=UPI001F2D9673|nr:hypothetical protein [Cereibacter sphaeroides]MCE6959615.1 hypothetical protein [Cereibacter sphaeroides]MCE6974525.1 hypothetical protein [Cereibacter sphaeroides]
MKNTFGPVGWIFLAVATSSTTFASAAETSQPLLLATRYSDNKLDLEDPVIVQQAIFQCAGLYTAMATSLKLAETRTTLSNRAQTEGWTSVELEARRKLVMNLGVEIARLVTKQDPEESVATITIPWAAGYGNFTSLLVTADNEAANSSREYRNILNEYYICEGIRLNLVEMGYQ